MIRRKPLLAVLGAIAVAASLFVATNVIGSDDSPRSGEITRVETYPNGSVDTYRQQDDGEVVIEHRSASGEVWFESNEVLGTDGDPIICPNGEPLRIDFDTADNTPTKRQFARARRHVPAGKSLAWNQYTGKFQTVEAMRVQQGDTTVLTQIGLVYKCDANNQPTLVPLEKVDPAAAEAARKDMEQALTGGADGLSGLGADPASADK